MPKAQTSIEYLIVTAFMLVIITVIFAFSLMTTNTNLKNRQASESLETIIQTTDLVESMGKGNIQFVDVIWPNETTSIVAVHKCYNVMEKPICTGSVTESTDPAAVCGIGSWDCVKYSALKLTIGNNYLTYVSKARLDVKYTCDAPYTSEPLLVKGVKYQMKIEKDAGTGIVKIKRYCGT